MVNHNILNKILTQYWKSSFNGVLEHLKYNFSILNTIVTDPNTNLPYKYEFIFRPIIYILAFNYYKNACSICNTRYATHGDFLYGHYSYDEYTCPKDGYTHLDKKDIKSKYHWILEDFTHPLQILFYDSFRQDIDTFFNNSTYSEYEEHKQRIVDSFLP